MRNLIYTSFLVLVTGFSQAQITHIFATAGMMNYQGDLQPRRITYKQANPYFGAGLYFEATSRLYIKFSILSGKVGADDKLEARNRTRNLNFTSRILEAQLGAEFDLINSYDHSVVPYIFAGIAAYHFDPYTYLGKQQVFLQPLGTEGQGTAGKPKYSLTQLAIPFGGGLKFAVNDDVSIRLEAILRMLSTDYLDDVSTFYVPEAQLTAANGPIAAELSFRGDELTPALPYPTTSVAIRGNPKSKDFYYTAGVSISYRLNNGSGSGGGGSKGKLGCPVNIY